MATLNKNVEPKKKSPRAIALDISQELREAAITLDIKNNVINELQCQVDSYINLHNKTETKKIPALDKITTQFFWASSDMQFKEEKSCKQSCQLTSSTHVISFPLTENIKDIHFFRFDIGDSIGFLNIHNIELKDSTGNVVWHWDEKSILYKNGLLLISKNKHWTDKTIQLSVCDDPHFILANDFFDNYTVKDKLSVNITLSAFEQSQSDFLFNTALASLSFYSEIEISNFQNLKHTLQNENRLLLSEITLTRSLIENFNNEKTALYNKISAAELLLQSITTDKNKLLDENQQLTAQLTIHKEIADEALVEKKNIEIKLSLLCDKQVKIDLDIANLQRITSSDELIINNLKENISKQETLFAKNIEASEIIIKQLITDKFILVNDLDERKEILHKLLEDKKNIDLKLTIKEDLLSNVISEKENLHTELVNRNTNIIQLQNTKQQLEESLTQSQSQISEFLIEKAEAVEKISILNKHIGDIILQNGNLINQTEELQRRLEQLNVDFISLNKFTANKENDLNQATQSNIAMAAALRELSTRIQSFEDNYEKKNLLQICINRIFSKTKKTPQR